MSLADHLSWRKPSSWSLLLCLLLAGCSTRVVYYWLDVAIVWQLDDYFSLDRPEALAGQRSEGLMAWHRQREVPRYADDPMRWPRRWRAP